MFRLLSNKWVKEMIPPFENGLFSEGSEGHVIPVISTVSFPPECGASATSRNVGLTVSPCVSIFQPSL